MQLRGLRSSRKNPPPPHARVLGGLPYAGNVNKWKQLSQLEVETLNMGRQPSYAGERQLRRCSAEPARLGKSGDRDLGRSGEMGRHSQGETRGSQSLALRWLLGVETPTWERSLEPRWELSSRCIQGSTENRASRQTSPAALTFAANAGLGGQN